MSKQNNKPEPAGDAKNSRLKLILGNVIFVLVVVGIVWGTQYYKKSRANRPSPAEPANASITSAPPKSAQSPASTNQVSLTNPNIPSIGPVPDLSRVEVDKAIMVTKELDFGPNVPSIAEALQYIERRYQPEDGKGRTFAILDAYGEATPDKKLHISMHVSTEKAGGAALIFTKTGEVLWKAQIMPSTNTHGFTGNNLTIYLGTGVPEKAWLLDGSMGPATIFDAKVRDLNKPVRELWPDGEEREMTFVYSSCGCPVKVMVKRVGDRTVRTKELPVIFPDDPAALGVISKLMGW